MKQVKVKDRVKHETDYVAFLKKRVESKNYKANVSKEEFEETLYKYQKAKLLLRMLAEK